VNLQSIAKASPRRASSNSATRARNGTQRALSFGHELPRVPRRYGQWAGAAFFIVLCVLLAGWFWQQQRGLEPVLVMGHAVSVGSRVTADDLKAVEVSGVTGAISSHDSSQVVGRTAAVGLVKGQILTTGMVTDDPVPGAGERVVGMELDATHAPAGLQPGDLVEVLAVPVAGNSGGSEDLGDPTVLAATATVLSASAVEGAGTRMTLLVPAAVAEEVAAYVSAGRVALIEAPIGGDD
jgi:hypothetical protein